MSNKNCGESNIPDGKHVGISEVHHIHREIHRLDDDVCERLDRDRRQIARRGTSGEPSRRPETGPQRQQEPELVTAEGRLKEQIPRAPAPVPVQARMDLRGDRRSPDPTAFPEVGYRVPSRVAAEAARLG